MSDLISLEEAIMNQLVEAGLDRSAEATQEAAGNIERMFQRQLNRAQIVAVVTDLEKALEMRNKILIVSTGEIMEDVGNRKMIDPNILKARADNLRKQLES